MKPLDEHMVEMTTALRNENAYLKKQLQWATEGLQFIGVRDDHDVIQAIKTWEQSEPNPCEYDGH